MTMDCAQQLAAWRYPAPYDCYDFPEWARMEAQRWAITLPERHREFRALYRGGHCAGWFWLRRQDDRVVFSCGLHPDECGHGVGAELMAVVLDHCATHFPGEVVELSVRPFNERARRVYARAGFQLAHRDHMCRVKGPGGEALQPMVMLTRNHLRAWLETWGTTGTA